MSRRGRILFLRRRDEEPIEKKPKAVAFFQPVKERR